MHYQKDRVITIQQVSQRHHPTHRNLFDVFIQILKEEWLRSEVFAATEFD